MLLFRSSKGLDILVDHKEAIEVDFWSRGDWVDQSLNEDRANLLIVELNRLGRHLSYIFRPQLSLYYLIVHYMLELLDEAARSHLRTR